MANLTRIQQQVYDCVREHNDEKGLTGKYYYYMYCCAGYKDVQSQEAFDELLEELQDEKLLKTMGKSAEGESLFCLENSEEAVQGGEICREFAALQYELQGCNPALLEKTAKDAMLQLIPNMGFKDRNFVIQALVLAASIGTEGKAPLNPPEKSLVRHSFGTMLSNSMDFIYRMMEQPLDEEAFGMMTMFCNVGGREVGMNLLRLILAFAYADGDISPELTRKLNNVFRPVLEPEEK